MGNEKLHCCIVDDHCDVVPFVHSFWRAKKVKHDQKVVLVHFDAHPDLSIPSTTKHQNCFGSWRDTEVLYDILNEEGGIAEFIIPLIANKILSQVIWVRSEWCEQLPDGHHRFHLVDRLPSDNVDNGSTKKKSRSSNINAGSITTAKDNNLSPSVAYNTAYYIDEGVYRCKQCCETISTEVDSCTIDLITTLADSVLAINTVHGDGLLSLLTAEESAVGGLDISSLPPLPRTDNTPSSWILDICLDYFSTLNPFLVELQQSVRSDFDAMSTERRKSLYLSDWELTESSGSDNHGEIVSTVVDIIRNAYKYLEFRQQKLACVSVDGSDGVASQELNGNNKRLRPSFNSDRECQCECSSTNRARERAMAVMKSVLCLTMHIAGVASCEINATATAKISKAAACSPEISALLESIAAEMAIGQQLRQQLQQQQQQLDQRGFLSLFSAEHQHHAQAFLNLLPFLSDNTRQRISDSGPLLLLPHHQSSGAEVDSLITQMIAFIRMNLLNKCSDTQDLGLPLFVTIARSSGSDEYTPTCQVDEIQRKVLVAVDALFSEYRLSTAPGGRSDNTMSAAVASGISSSQLFENLIIHDMCEDAHDKCYGLFRNKLHLVSDPLPCVSSRVTV